MLISIDPGLRACGVAVWVYGLLARACLVKNQAAWPEMVEEVRRIEPSLHATNHLVVELPQVYVRNKSKGDPNDLIDLAVLVGALVSGRAHTLYRPHEWKGNVPKAVTELRCRKRLSAEELARVELPTRSLAHNVWDALGLGLHHLGR